MSMKIRLPRKHKSLPIDERTIPELIVGKDYYVCFGNNVVHQCKLLEILENNKISIKKMRPTCYKTLTGKRYGHFNTVFKDEIGETPIQAVHNTVTF